MKKIAYFSIVMFLIIFTSSCDEENYKDMNITHIEKDLDIKELIGDLTSHIVMKDMNGEVVTEVDMGETVYIIDNTSGGADSRKWEITKGGVTTTSTDQLVRLNYPGPGNVTISLSSTRTSDGKTITSNAALGIKSIPVTASFITDPVMDGSSINILTSRTVAFTSTSLGSPTIFSWVFEGPETLTSAEKDPTITFMKPGVYNVSFSATRDDGAEGISEDVVVKQAYIQVDQLVVDYIRAIATDNKIELQFTQPVAQDIPANATSEFSIKINTKSGSVLNPAVLAIAAKGDYAVELTFADKMYSDDEVLLSFNPTGILKDASGFYLPEIITSEPCVYGYNLWTNTDTEDGSKFSLSTNSAGSGFYEMVDENSAILPMKPYQGHSCLGFIRGDDKIGISVLQGYTVAEGDVVELAYEGKTVESFGGALERRMSKTMASGGNDANGNWSNAKDNGGLNEWKTITKSISVSSGTKGQTGELFLTFFRYSGSDTGALWLDNLRIYKPNPRP